MRCEDMAVKNGMAKDLHELERRAPRSETPISCAVAQDLESTIELRCRRTREKLDLLC